MKGLYTLKQKIIAYFMTVLLVIHSLPGNVIYDAVRAEGAVVEPAVTLKIGSETGQDVADSVIRQNEVTIYYAFDEIYQVADYTFRYTLCEDDGSDEMVVDLGASTGTFIVNNENSKSNKKYTLRIEANNATGEVLAQSTTTVSFLLGVNVPTCDIQLSDNGVAQNKVVVTYFAEKEAEDEVAYRKVEKVTTEGAFLLHEGEIVWEDGSDVFSRQCSETYSTIVIEEESEIYSVDEGTYKVSYCLKDAGGNTILGTEQSCTFIIDSTVPKAELTCMDTDGMAKDQVDCKVIVADENFDPAGIVIIVQKETPDGNTIVEKIEDENFENNVDKIISFEEEGKYTVHVQAKDIAGNTTITDKLSFIIDRTKPVVSIDAGNKDNGAICNTKIEDIVLLVELRDTNLIENSCKVVVKREDQVVDIRYQWSGTAREKTAKLVFDDSFIDGTYSVYVLAKDLLGQFVEKKFAFTIDNTVVSIQDLKVTYEDGSAANGVVEGEETDYYLKATAKVTFLAVEKNYTNTEIYMKTKKDGTLIAEETISMNTEKESVNRTYVEEGSYCTVVYGKDSAGNQSEQQQQCFVIDKQAPLLKITQVVDGIESAVGENQLFSIEDDRKLRFSVVEKYHNKDAYQIKVERATDMSWFPQVTIMKGSEVTWDCVDGTEQIYFDNTDLFKEEGRYTVTFTGEDLAGNCAVSQRVSFYIDSTAPTIVQTSAIKDGFYYNKAVCFEYDIYEFNYSNATASIAISRTLDGVTYQTTDNLSLNGWTTSFQYLCSEEGAYTITVIAADQAGNEAIGNVSQKGYTVKFVVDTSAPSIVISGVTSRQKTRDTIELVLESRDRNHDFSQYRIDVVRSDVSGEIEHFSLRGNTISSNDLGSGWSTDGYTASDQTLYMSQRKLSFHQEGIYQVTVTGQDIAGNDVKEKIITFTIDRTAPVISNVTYANTKGLLLQKYQSIFSQEAILMEFTVEDAMIGVNDDEVYVTVGNATKWDEDIVHYPVHKALGNRYYVYIPIDLQVEEFTGVITIWAQDLLQNESNVVSSNIVYTIESPTIRMECDVDYSKWTNRDVTFHTTITDEMAGLKQVVYRVNGTIVKKEIFESHTMTYQYDVTASENATEITGYTVSVEATNNCGVTHIIEKQVYIDKEKPVIQLSGVQNGAHYRENQTFKTHVDDVSYTNTKTVYYVTRTLDGKTTSMSLGYFSSKKYEDNCTRKVLREGKYRIYAIATDSAGNKKKSNTLSFVIDKTEPMLNIKGISNDAMSGKAVTLQLECVESFFATSETKIKIEKEMDGKITESTIIDFLKNEKKSFMTKTFSQDGTYTVTMTARDKAGNVAKTKSVTFSVDTTKPAIRISGTDNYQMWEKQVEVWFVVEESYYSGNEVTIVGTRTDINGNKEKLELPRFFNTGKISSLKEIFAKDGFYEFYITARDKAGNTDSNSIHFTIDRTNPEINGVDQYQGGYYRSFQLAKSLDGVFRDLTVVSYRILLNGVEYNGTDVIEEEGKYNLYVEVEDELGHTNIQNIEFIIDHTPPKVIFSGVKEEEMITESGVVSLFLTDADDRITAIRMNGVEYDKDTRQLAYTEPGVYCIEVDCKDLAGNTVTRELHFVYNNAIIITLIVLMMIILIIGVCVWLGWHTTKGKKEERT